ncbi:hypothetical protein SLS61_000276 [Didymella pomorum]
MRQAEEVQVDKFSVLDPDTACTGPACYAVANIEYVVLHEIMHVNIITFSKNGNRHIFDMELRIRGIDRTFLAQSCGLKMIIDQADNFALYAPVKGRTKGSR